MQKKKIADKTMLPYALPWHNAIPDAEWQHKVDWFSHAKYLQDMEAVDAERQGLGSMLFYCENNESNESNQIFFARVEALCVQVLRKSP